MKHLKTKLRLDEYLVENEYFENIEAAKRNIMVGNVIINDIKKEKAGEIIDIQKIKMVRIKGSSCPYVSRGGYKLEKAIRNFNLDFTDKIVLDIGASTGGFTDCALQNKAKFIYAIDVGTNQLAWKLRNNKKIKSIENKHINDLEMVDIDNLYPDFIVMDISFISIRKVMWKLKELLQEDSKGIFLIKPQFEVEKEFLEKGIVKDLDEHKRILKKIIIDFEEKGVYLENISLSAIRGTKGNIEYLTLFTAKKENKLKNIDEVIDFITSRDEHNKIY